MNIIGQIDPSAFACSPRMHHGEPTLEFPSSAGSRRRGLLALRAMMWGAAGGAPKPYDAEVEWLEGTGTQFIRTEAVSATTDVIRAKFTVSPTSGDRIVFIGGTYAVNRNMVYVATSSRSIYWAGANVNLVRSATGVVYDFRSDGVSKTLVLSADGNVVSSLTNVNTTVNGPGAYCLFSDASTNLSKIGSGRIYSFSVDGKLDMIPVRKDGIGYFYDRVSGELFGNLGTGAFAIGPDI